MRDWTLSKSSFDDLLSALDPNRDSAALRYESLRARLVKFFEWRACAAPDELADETLDRLARKFETGAPIEDPVNYAYGIARMIVLETVKREARERQAVADMPAAEEEEDDGRMSCLEKCLSSISLESRTLIIAYYSSEKRAKIDLRQHFADRLGISINALRIKAHRVRLKIEECVFRCLNGEIVK